MILYLYCNYINYEFFVNVVLKRYSFLIMKRKGRHKGVTQVISVLDLPNYISATIELLYESSCMNITKYL